MTSRRRRNGTAGRGVAFSVVVTLALLTACGAPLEPVPSSWERVGTLPIGGDEINAFKEDGRGGLLIAGATEIAGGEDQGYLLEYRNGVARELTRIPHVPSSVTCAYADGDGVWFGGSYEVPGKGSAPYLAYYDLTTGKTTSVVIPPGCAETGVGDVAALPSGHLLVYTEKGVFNVNGDLWTRILTFDTYDSCRLLVSPKNPPVIVYRRFYADNPNLIVSNDGGITWLDNPLHVSIPGYSISQPQYYFNAVWAGGLLYYRVGAEVAETGVSYAAVVAADVKMPSPRFDLIFMAPQGPFFYGVGDMAFEDERNGVGFSPWSTVVEKDGVWAFEASKVPGTRTKGAALSGDYYWGLVYDDVTRTNTLWRHPLLKR